VDKRSDMNPSFIFLSLTFRAECRHPCQ